MLSTLDVDVANAVQDQINAAAEVERRNANSLTTVQDQINAAVEDTRVNVTDSATSIQDKINAAVEIPRANATSITSEVDEALVTGGNFLEDAFGGMTLDEEVIEPPKDTIGITSRQGSFDATTFQPIRTPQQQHSNSDENYRSPLEARNMAGQQSILRSSINATKVIPHTIPNH